MRRLSLDYQRPALSSPWPGLVMLTLALFWAGDLVLDYRQVTDEITARTPAIIDVAVHRKAPAPNEPVRSPAQIQNLKQDIELTNRIIAELTVPWEELFNAVESAQNGDIALLELQPDTHRKILTISGEARNFTALSGYLHRVQAQRSFANVYLLRHEVQTEDPQRPIRFELKADWQVQS